MASTTSGWLGIGKGQETWNQLMEEKSDWGHTHQEHAPHFKSRLRTTSTPYGCLFYRLSNFITNHLLQHLFPFTPLVLCFYNYLLSPFLCTHLSSFSLTTPLLKISIFCTTPLLLLHTQSPCIFWTVLPVLVQLCNQLMKTHMVETYWILMFHWCYDKYYLYVKIKHPKKQLMVEMAVYFISLHW